MPEHKANILVVFYSRDGSVETLAKAVSEGAREAGAEVRLRRVPDIVSPAVMAKARMRSITSIGTGSIKPSPKPLVSVSRAEIFC